MATDFDVSVTTKVLDYENNKARVESMVEAIVRSRGVMVLCGPEVQEACGIPVSL